MQPPKIDPRTYEEIVEQTEKLAQSYTTWCPHPDGKPDAGRALIRIFGRMVALVSDRLNQVPDKNFLAFLNLIGTQIQPPQPARVPITFSLVEGSPADALVPANTQVAAPPASGEEEEVVFETEKDLVVPAAQLQAVFVRQPDTDCYSDHTSPATGKLDVDYPAFEGEQLIDHCLYLACDELFTLAGSKTATLTFDSPEAATLQGLSIAWSYWDGVSWKELTSEKKIVSNKYQVTINDLPPVGMLPINGWEAGWLQARLQQPLPQSRLPNISSLSVKVDIQHNNLAPDLCFFNTEELDLSKDFYPFGEQPSFNDTFYLASQQVFSQPGATVNIRIELSAGLPVQANAGIKIHWEVWNGTAWEKRNKSPVEGNPADNFTNNGTVTFTLPDKVEPHEVNGETNYWVRARIVAGNYGTEAVAYTALRTEAAANTKILQVASVRGFKNGDRITIALGTANQESKSIQQVNLDNKLTLDENVKAHPIGTSVELEPLPLAPPSVKSLSLGYTNQKNSPISTCLTFNDFAYHTYQIAQFTTTVSAVAAKKGEKTIRLAEVAGLAAGDRIPIGSGNTLEYGEIEQVNAETKTVTLKTGLERAHKSGTRVVPCFQPFTPTHDCKPTLYLGFDQPFPNLPISLYAQVEPPAPGQLAARATKLVNSASSGQKNLSVERVQGFTKGQKIRIASGGSNQEDGEIDIDPASNQLTLKTDLTYTHGEGTRVEVLASTPRLVWEYASPSGWTLLGATDETNAFSERGLIQFIGPKDFTQRSEFGQPLYWLRVHWVEGEFLVPPRLRRLLTNTTWASQVSKIDSELLGSSNGNPDQTFYTAQSPVLPGQQLEVQENLSDADRAAIEKGMGKEVIAEIRDEAGEIDQLWVRWEHKTDFYSSGKSDRHYLLDSLTGQVQFGNGQQGMIPPLGANNIRLTYKTGGGKQGNKPAQAIAELKTTIPYIDSVTNLEAAGGGADRESLERVKERGPKTLRHRFRAVTQQDIEDLAFEASPDVARARAITPKFDPNGNWLPTYHIRLDGPGDIKVEVTQDVASAWELQVNINGPGQANPYFSSRVTKETPTKSYTVTAEQFGLGEDWQVTISNPTDTDANGSGNITYPNGSCPIEFRSLKKNPHSDIVDAGRVELIIVPQSLANQPTPSLGLLNRVRDYILERYAPTVSLPRYRTGLGRSDGYRRSGPGIFPKCRCLQKPYPQHYNPFLTPAYWRREWSGLVLWTETPRV